MPPLPPHRVMVATNDVKFVFHGHATASNFDAVPYAVGAQRPLAPALVHAVGGEVSDKRSISGGKVNNRTFLNFTQLYFTSIYNCDRVGNEDLPLPG